MLSSSMLKHLNEDNTVKYVGCGEDICKDRLITDKKSIVEILNKFYSVSGEKKLSSRFK